METTTLEAGRDAMEVYGGYIDEPLAATDINEYQLTPRLPSTICPILKAGTMLNLLHGMVSSADLSPEFDSCYCMGHACAWYEHGCPAYPGK